jgi:hypothetical protein
MQKYFGAAIIAIVCGLFSGCTSEQIYGTGQAYQRNQCLDMPEQGERNRCLSKTNASYDDYRQSTEPERKTFPEQ